MKVFVQCRILEDIPNSRRAPVLVYLLIWAMDPYILRWNRRFALFVSH